MNVPLSVSVLPALGYCNVLESQMERPKMENKISQATREILRTAGWIDGRNVTQALRPAIQLELFPKAEEVLSEFGGLHIGKCGPGIDCATSDVNISPDLCMHLANELRVRSASIGKRLYPLGEVHRGHGYLVIDEDGRTYLLSDELVLHGAAFWVSLEALLLGKRKAPNEPLPGYVPSPPARVLW